MKIFKGFIAKIMLGVACLTSIPQQALQADTLISEMKDFSTILKAADVDKNYQSISSWMMSPLNGLTAQQNIEQICRLNVKKGKMAKLVGGMLFYHRPDNSFGPTIAPHRIGTYLTPKMMGIIVAIIFQQYLYLANKGGENKEEEQGAGEKRKELEMRIEKVKEELHAEAEMENVNKEIREFIKEKKGMHTKEQLDLKRKEIVEKIKNKKGDSVKKLRSQLIDLKNEMNALKEPKIQLKQKAPIDGLAELLEKGLSGEYVKIQKVIKDIQNELLKLATLEKNLKEKKDDKEKKQLGDKIKRYNEKLNKFPLKIWKGDEHAIKGWIKEKCEEFAKLLSGFITKVDRAEKQLLEEKKIKEPETSEEKQIEEKKITEKIEKIEKEEGIKEKTKIHKLDIDHYCNKQTLLDTFLVLLVYRCEKRSDFIGYFEGLQEVLGDEIFAKKDILSDNEFWNDKNVYTGQDYKDNKEKVSEELLKGVFNPQLYEKLLLLYFGYFIFEAPLPPYHCMVTNISWIDASQEFHTYPDCGENSSRLFWELLIYNLGKRIFDVSLLEEINKRQAESKNEIGEKKDKIAEYGRVTIADSVLTFFKENSELTDSSQKHQDWAHNVCENIPNVKYNHTDQGSASDIKGGVFNMVKALAYWFGLDLKRVDEKKQSYYVFESIRKAFEKVGINFSHNIPTEIEKEPTESGSPSYAFIIQRPGSDTKTKVTWNFHPNHFEFIKWEIEVPVYQNTYNFLVKNIELSSLSVRSMCIDLLLLFMNNSKSNVGSKFLKKLLVDKTTKPHVIDILCNSNSRIKGKLIKYFITNSDDVGEITSNDRKSFVNKLLPTITDFAVLKPILKDICNNKKQKFYFGAAKVLNTLRDEDEKAKAMIVLINIVSENDKSFIKEFKEHVLSLVDERNKKRVIKALIEQGQATAFNNVIVTTLRCMKDDGYKGKVLCTFIKQNLAKESKNIIVEILNSMKDDESKSEVLEAFIEQGEAIEFNNVIVTTLGNMKNDLYKSNVLIVLIEKKLAIAFKNIIVETLSNIKNDDKNKGNVNKRGVLITLIKNGQTKAFRDVIIKTLVGMKDDDSKRDVLNALKK